LKLDEPCLLQISTAALRSNVFTRPDAFAQDAARNGQVTNQVVLGIRILSAPNAAGNFEIERAGQQVGEAVPPTFLAPHRREERTINAGCGSPVAQSAEPDPQEGYQAFLAAAQPFGFEPQKNLGRDEPRLQGFRQ
jgi:hypothetical protein